jgi:hypothetical protein
MENLLLAAAIVMPFPMALLAARFSLQMLFRAMDSRRN